MNKDWNLIKAISDENDRDLEYSFADLSPYLEILREKLIEDFTSDDAYHFFASIIGSYGEVIEGKYTGFVDYAEHRSDLCSDLEFFVKDIINERLGWDE